MWKGYNYLAKRLVPIGEQIGISHGEKVEMMKSKTRRFSAADIGNSGRNEWQRWLIWTLVGDKIVLALAVTCQAILP
jgi:hypothetical protein